PRGDGTDEVCVPVRHDIADDADEPGRAAGEVGQVELVYPAVIGEWRLSHDRHGLVEVALRVLDGEDPRVLRQCGESRGLHRCPGPPGDVVEHDGQRGRVGDVAAVGCDPGLGRP